MTRHIGKNVETGARYIVAFMAIKGAEDHALVIEADTLPLRFQDSLMDVVNAEGQNYERLGELLGMRRFPDNTIMLEALHTGNRLLKVPTNKVLMTPDATNSINLAELNQRLGVQLPTEPIVNDIPEEYKVENTSMHEDNLKAESTDDQLRIAQNLLLEANMIEQQAEHDANERRERAYSYAPQLRPSVQTDEGLEDRLSPADPKSFVDDVTGKSYKSEAALKAAITRRTKKKPTRKKITD